MERRTVDAESFVFPKPLVIDIIGNEYRWYYRYPGADGILDTPDDILSDGDLHLPINMAVVLQLKSKDNIYTFSLPHINQLKMAIPEMIFKLEFTPDSLGVFVLEGEQMCGFSHDSLKANLIVETRVDFTAWLMSQSLVNTENF